MHAQISKSLLAISIIGAATLWSVASQAGAGHQGGHGGGHHGGENSAAIGEPGTASGVTRTVEVVMGDAYFEPEKISVQAGETIRFVVRNEGEFLHEFNIGTAAMHAEHQAEMMTMMEHGMITADGVDHEKMKMDHTSDGMAGHAHDDPNSVLVEPGKMQELIWKFGSPTALEFACNVPGHYDAGMMGRITFERRQSS